MPARVFRNQVENTVQGHTMTLEAHSLCGGCWTPGGWEPPATIVSGSTRGWQSESCGFMTGTQGWVKYRLQRDSDGVNRGLIYIYWTNPYFGVTLFKHGIWGQNTVADCDEDSSGAGSNFSDSAGENARPSDLFLDVVGTRKNGDPATVESLDEMILVPVAPFVVLGAGGIWERMEIAFRLRSTETPTLVPPPRPKTRSIETNPQPATFTGTWTGSSLSVFLSLIGPWQFRARVSDHTQATPLELVVDTSLGVTRAVLAADEFFNTEFARESRDIDENSILRSSVALAALSVSLRFQDERPAGTPDWMARARRSTAVLGRPLTRTTIKNHAQDIGIVASRELDIVTSFVAERAREANYILHLRHGIVLYLVKVEEDGQVVDYKLHYQRIGEDGAPLVDTDLTYLIQIN